MPIFSIQSPLDQPTGVMRLLNELKINLKRSDFHTFYIISAFAKVGPLVKLKSLLNDWTSRGFLLNSAFGIDDKGTSIEALEFAILNFNNSFVARVSNKRRSTFHPKIYFFDGNHTAVAYLGSNNLTVGGTETNAESFIKIEMSFPSDNQIRSEIIRCWSDTIRMSLPLNSTLLQQLTDSDLVVRESEMRRDRSNRNQPVQNQRTNTNPPVFPTLITFPPSPIPKQTLINISSPITPVPQANSLLSGIQALVIQIVPHHNGEIFLSKNAVDQNFSFFKWPFTGHTIPKRAGNPAYPQLIPDPIVKIQVYDLYGNIIVQHNNHNLNTVYYSTKSEIRITVPPDVVHNTPPYSIMVMQVSNEDNLDYELLIYPDGTQEYQNYIQVCNQTMPSGGSPRSRRFGWI